MLDRHMRGEHICIVTEVVGSDEFSEWFDSLDDADTDAVARVVDMLEMGRPDAPLPLKQLDQGFQARAAGAANPVGG
jgi:hypothetical protein